MLQINIEGRELWDEKNNCFIQVKPITVTMEHSLISISKWESKWKKSFLDPKITKTREELLDYFSCMVIKPSEVPWTTFLSITDSQMKEIVNYIKDERTATTITYIKKRGPKSREIITSELVYYWMVAAQIPFDPCEKWHISRLFKLIEIYGIKNDTKGQKKMTRNEIISQNDALNEARKAKYKTKG